MAISIAREDETIVTRFNLVYEDPAEGGPGDALVREREFASEVEAETWVAEQTIVPLRLDLVERIYNRAGSIVFTCTDSARYDPVRGY